MASVVYDVAAIGIQHRGVVVNRNAPGSVAIGQIARDQQSPDAGTA
jgi:hypothetical protein